MSPLSLEIIFRLDRLGGRQFRSPFTLPTGAGDSSNSERRRGKTKIIQYTHTHGKPAESPFPPPPSSSFSNPITGGEKRGVLTTSIFHPRFVLMRFFPFSGKWAAASAERCPICLSAYLLFGLHAVFDLGRKARGLNTNGHIFLGI